MKQQRRHSAAVTIAVESWDEQRYDEMPDGGPALAQATFVTRWSGDADGTGACRMLITYTEHDGPPETWTGDYVAFERFTGSLGGRSGSFVLDCRGSHTDGAAHTKVRVVPGSATGELEGLEGSGSYDARGQTYTLALEYAFDTGAVF